MPMELQGFDNLRDDLTNMASNLEFGAGVNRALQEGAKPIEEQMLHNASSDPQIITGALHGSIRTHSVRKSRSGGKHITIGVKHSEKGAYYANPVEHGHGGPAPAPAHPFVRPAFDVRKDEAYQIMKNMYAKIEALSNAAVKGEEIPQDEQISVTDAMDVMIRWFCLLFGNQFSPDDVLDGYPVDRLMHDIALALMAVQTQTTEILSQFPTKAAKEPTPPQPATEAEEIPLF